MDPITHLRIHNQGHHTFERQVRRGRLGLHVGRTDAGGDPSRTAEERNFLTLVRLLHMRHA